MTGLVDMDAMLKVIGAALIAGIGVTGAFSLAVFGSTRLADMRRAKRPVAAGAFGVLAAVGIAACVAAIVYGLVEMAAE